MWYLRVCTISLLIYSKQQFKINKKLLALIHLPFHLLTSNSNSEHLRPPLSPSPTPFSSIRSRRKIHIQLYWWWSVCLFPQFNMYEIWMFKSFMCYVCSCYTWQLTIIYETHSGLIGYGDHFVCNLEDCLTLFGYLDWLMCFSSNSSKLG